MVLARCVGTGFRLGTDGWCSPFREGVVGLEKVRRATVWYDTPWFGGCTGLRRWCSCSTVLCLFVVLFCFLSSDSIVFFYLASCGFIRFIHMHGYTHFSLEFLVLFIPGGHLEPNIRKAVQTCGGMRATCDVEPPGPWSTYLWYLGVSILMTSFEYATSQPLERPYPRNDSASPPAPHRSALGRRS